MPKTLDYWILRTCEQLHLNESDFLARHYPEQVRLLAYTALRQREDDLQPRA